MLNLKVPNWDFFFVSGFNLPQNTQRFLYRSTYKNAKFAKLDVDSALRTLRFLKPHLEKT